jgi:prepilin-type N-terminal cleavage/methylation domain-containing protein
MTRSMSRVGSRRALLAAYHRGRVWEPSQGSHPNGFSLLEVMISMAILAIALVSLTRTVTGNVRATMHARMVTAATFLARTKISTIEQVIQEVGFSESEAEDQGDFKEEGFERFAWKAKVERVKLPTSAIQDVQQATQKRTTSKNPMDVLSGFMGSFMTTLMEPIRLGLEGSVRRITLKVQWTEPGRPPQEFEIVTFLTDPSKLNMAMQGPVGAAAAGATPGGKTGTATTPGSPTTPGGSATTSGSTPSSGLFGGKGSGG